MRRTNTRSVPGGAAGAIGADLPELRDGFWGPWRFCRLPTGCGMTRLGVARSLRARSGCRPIRWRGREGCLILGCPTPGYRTAQLCGSVLNPASAGAGLANQVRISVGAWLLSRRCIGGNRVAALVHVVNPDLLISVMPDLLARLGHYRKMREIYHEYLVIRTGAGILRPWHAAQVKAIDERAQMSGGECVLSEIGKCPLRHCACTAAWRSRWGGHGAGW